jgi:pSer/pThr/pTyr-binding forkhead associated (FHA) protein
MESRDMEISELTIWVARLGVLVLMYLFVLAIILAIRADARAASESPALSLRPPQMPSPQSSSVPAPPPPVHKLLVTAGTLPLGGREFQLFGVIDIGRNASCAISIPNNFVSTHHARMQVKDGRWILEDLGSTNGTLLNGQLLVGAHTLKPGDTIHVGDTELLVQ